MLDDVIDDDDVVHVFLVNDEYILDTECSNKSSLWSGVYMSVQSYLGLTGGGKRQRLPNAIVYSVGRPSWRS